MVTRDVLKVLKLHSPTACAILRTFKTSLVPINHEMHSRSYNFLYLFTWVVNNFLLTECEGSTVSYGGTGTKVRDITLEFYASCFLLLGN